MTYVPRTLALLVLVAFAFVLIVGTDRISATFRHGLLPAPTFAGPTPYVPPLPPRR